MVHPDFAEWYHIVSIAPSTEQIEKRWQAVEQITSTFTAQQMLEVVRLFQPDLISSSQTNAIVQAFQNADPIFPKRGNDVELQVLAASVIIDAISKTPTARTDAIALATICSSYTNKRTSARIVEAYDLALKYLSDEGQRVRASGALASIEFKPFATINAKKLQDASEALTTSPVPTSITALNDIVVTDVNGVRELLNQVLKSIIQNQKTLATNQQILSEEIEISWWLIGEWSRDLDQPYSSLSLSQAGILAAKELADITVQMPGPPSAKHLIAKVLRTHREDDLTEITLQQAINSVSREWRESLIHTYSPAIVGNLCPVLMAAQKSLETDGEDDWIPAYKKMVNVDPTDMIAPLSLAYQTYLECLLVRTLQ